mgnify:CR=1 FL=1
MMKEGDLCYIPQAVRLFNQGNPYVQTTERPLIGIFIKEQDAHHSAIFTQESRLRNLHEQGLLHSGLDPEHRFSKLTINRGHNGTDIVVVGAPELVEEQLKTTTKQLLRG